MCVNYHELESVLRTIKWQSVSHLEVAGALLCQFDLPFCKAVPQNVFDCLSRGRCILA